MLVPKSSDRKVKIFLNNLDEEYICSYVHIVLCEDRELSFENMLGLLPCVVEKQRKTSNKITAALMISS